MAGRLVCRWCGRGFERPSRKGPAPEYCSAGHRRRAFEYRRLRREVAESLEVAAAGYDTETIAGFAAADALYSLAERCRDGSWDPVRGRRSAVR